MGIASKFMERMGGGIGPAGVGGAAVALAFAVMVPMRWVGLCMWSVRWSVGTVGRTRLNFYTRLGMYFYFPEGRKPEKQ